MSFNGAGKFRPQSLSYHQVVGIYGPTGDRVIDVGADISKWILAQPIHLWKFSYDDTLDKPPAFCDRYVISDELYTLLLLKWAN